MCPNGVDVYFDNVGGEILDAALASIALGARIVVCGAISGMNDFQQRPGIRNHFYLIFQRGTMRGFLVFDYLDRAMEAIDELATWRSEGKIKNQVDVVEGLENAPDALRRLFKGENLGKSSSRSLTNSKTVALITGPRRIMWVGSCPREADRCGRRWSLRSW